VLGDLTMDYPVANFLVYMCQKLSKMTESGHSYCNKNCVQFFGPPCIMYNEGSEIT